MESRDSGDTVTGELLRVMREAYPIMLLPRTTPFNMNVTGSLFDHPSVAAFEAAVEMDDELISLYPEQPTDGTGRAGNYIGPSRGGGIQLSFLAAQLLATACDWTLLEEGVPTHDAVADRIEQLVPLVRRLAAGETVRFPARVSLAGVQLPEGVDHIDLSPLGSHGERTGAMRLRRRDHRDDWLLLVTGTDHEAVGTTDDGGEVRINYGGDIIVETSAPFKIRLGSLGDDPWPADLESLRNELRDDIEALRLGLTLVPNSDGPLVVMSSWQVSLDPFSFGANTSWSELRWSSRLIPRQLDGPQAGQWADWAQTLRTVDTTSIEIGKRRALLAAAERSMPEDVLIDAIMVWENLVGAPSETTFRVTAAMAHLLRPDLAGRRELVAEAKKIYEMRSRVVHGARTLTPKQAQIPLRALALAIDLLRAVIGRRPDLLSEADASARSNRLLLED